MPETQQSTQLGSPYMGNVKKAKMFKKVAKKRAKAAKKK